MSTTKMTSGCVVPKGDPVFDPAVHLGYSPPASRLSMEDLSLGTIKAPSKVGVTAPFPLASLEGIKALRQAMLQPAVLDNHLFFAKWTGNTGMLRGMAPESSKFIHDFWTHSATLAAMEDAVGEPLVPVFDYEIAHCNIQVPEGQDRRAYIDSLSADPFAGSAPASLRPTASEAVVAAPVPAPTEEDCKHPGAVIPYHVDGYPWVCVLMLSDVEGMEGGETEIKKGDGGPIRVLGPGIGHAVLMQGGAIEHCALPALNEGRERVTMITSLRPAKPCAQERAVLSKVRTLSNNHDLYHQFTLARLSLVRDIVADYEHHIEEKRATISSAYGSKGGIKAPTVVLEELLHLQNSINQIVATAIDQMGASDDPEDGLWTPKGFSAVEVWGML